MEYKSVMQIAAQWGISDRRVRALCQQGKIRGAIRKGRTWLIPGNAEKPVDGRATRYYRNDSPYAERQNWINDARLQRGSSNGFKRNFWWNTPIIPMQ